MRAIASDELISLDSNRPSFKAPSLATPRFGVRIGGIDLIRFAAALMVVVYHLSFIEWLSPRSLGSQLFAREAPIPSLAHWSWSGWIGVQIFFVISGFVIAFSSVGTSPRKFIRGRLLRLWPSVFVGATLSMTLYLTFSLLPADVVLLRYFKEISFWPVGPWLNGVVWTLGVEVMFYALVLAMLCKGKGASIYWLAIGLTVWSLAYYTLLWLPDGSATGLLHILKTAAVRYPRLTELALFNHGSFFAVGIFLYLFHQRKFALREALVAVASVVTCVLQIGRTYVWETTDYKSFDFNVHANIALPLAVWGGTMLLLVFFIKSARDGRDILLQVPSVTHLGRMTYPLYLVHTWVGLWVVSLLHRWQLPTWFHVSVAVLVALFVAWVIDVFVEPIVRHALAKAFDRLVSRPRS